MDTIVAPITPLVTSAVIVVRISGADATKVLSLVRDKNNNNLSVPPKPNTIHFYKFIINNGLQDDILLSYFKNPNSFTGEDVIELSFHGNPLIVKSALSAMYKLGFRDALAGEFSKRAFLNGKIDLTQAEAIQELIFAKSKKGMYYAYEQLSGSTKNEFHKMQDSLINLKAHIEAYIDFPDEDDTNIELDLLKNQINNIKNNIEKTITSYNLYRKSNKNISIALVGKPNVGKSSLLNKLLGFDRSIVSNTPGTTRDYVEESLHINNLPISIIDTAGIHETDDNLELDGINRTKKHIEKADIILILLAMDNPLDADDKAILDLTAGKNRIIIGNKLDSKSKQFTQKCDIEISALNNQNIDKLIEMIKSKTSTDDNEQTLNLATVTERHIILLEKLCEIMKTIEHNTNNLAIDKVALDLNEAIDIIKEITGEEYTEKVLDTIFNKFCIGK